MKMGTIAEKVFNQIYRVYDRFLRLATFRSIDRWQRELIDSTPLGMYVLDVGTGTGEILKKLSEKEKDFRLFGIDISLNMLKIANFKLSKGKKNFLLIKSDALKMPFKDRVMENIFFSLVFRHLPSEGILKEVSRVLKEGGYVSILDIGKPESRLLYTLIHFFMDKILRPFGRVVFSKEEWDYFVKSIEQAKTEIELRELFSKAGFRCKSYSRRFLGLIHIAVFRKEVATVDKI